MRLFFVLVAGLTLSIAGCAGGKDSSSSSKTTFQAQPPAANAGGPYSGTTGTAVSFTAAASSDPQGQALTYAWNFGDSATAIGINPNHTYSAAGSYTVSLTVTDTSGLSANATTKVAIAAALLPPVANIGGPYTGIAGTAVSFTAAGSSDPQGQTLIYGWTFGDGAAGTGVSPAHIYAAAGAYPVSLTVTNSDSLSSTATTNVTIAAAPTPGNALTGTVTSGQQPIAGAHVYLFAAGVSGYGQPAVSLLSVAKTGSSDSLGAYGLTGSDGSFTLTGDFTCGSGQQLYLYALGGNSGSGVNAVSGLLAAIGACPAVNLSVTVNEVSTVAAAYALAGFATDATHVSSSGTALARIGIANAFANAGNLVSLATGAALTVTPAGNGTVPQESIHVLANILASCVHTRASCNPLLATATADGTTAGTQPTDTATAAINIAHHPGMNVNSLYALALASPVFSPVLNYQGTPNEPTDFTVGLTFTGGGLYIQSSPISPSIQNLLGSALAIDGLGNVWSMGILSAVGFSSLGAPLSTSGFRYSDNAATVYGRSLAIDPVGDIWLLTANAIYELSNSGTEISPRTGFAAGPVPLGGAQANVSIASDGAGNIWVTHIDGTVSELNSSGAQTFSSNVGAYAQDDIAADGTGNIWISLAQPGSATASIKLSSSGVVLSAPPSFNKGGFVMAIDGSGNAWLTAGLLNSGGTLNLTKMSSAGVATTYPVSTANGGTGDLAIDGAGNAWLPSIGFYGSALAEISNSGIVLSPANGLRGDPGGFAYYGVNQPYRIAIDGSGDLWATNGNNALNEIIGIAVPVVTPISVAAKNNTLGTRP